MLPTGLAAGANWMENDEWLIVFKKKPDADTPTAFSSPSLSFESLTRASKTHGEQQRRESSCCISECGGGDHHPGSSVLSFTPTTSQ